MKQIPATWMPSIDDDLLSTYYSVKEMITAQDIGARLNQYLADGEIETISESEFNDLVSAMDDALDEFGYSNCADILHDELEERGLLR